MFKWTGSDVPRWWLLVDVFIVRSTSSIVNLWRVLRTEDARVYYRARSFSVIRPVTWNDLPLELRCMNSSVESFAKKLMTFLCPSGVYCAAHLRRLVILRYINWHIDWLISKQGAPTSNSVWRPSQSGAVYLSQLLLNFASIINNPK